MTRFRTRRRVETLPSGVRVVRQTVETAPELEWRLQAEAVRQLRALPDFGRTFTIAGDMNAARRSSREAVKAKATGMAAGDPDLRVYIVGGKLGLIEYKGERGRLSPAQIDRHALLAGLGFDVRVVKAATPEDAAAQTLTIVRGWLPANDNQITTIGARAQGGAPRQ